MATPVVVVASGGLAVSEATNGLPVTPTTSGWPVTIVASGGLPVVFISVAGVLWPGGVAPGSGSTPTYYILGF
jgi:hypothetical protein